MFTAYEVGSSYIMMEICLIILSAVIWLKIKSSFGTEAEIRRLKKIVACYVAMLVFDSADMAIVVHWVHASKMVCTIIRSISLGLLPWVCYNWYEFVLYRIGYRNTHHNSKIRIQIVKSYPFVTAVLLLISCFNGCIVSLDDNYNYVIGPLVGLTYLVNFRYILGAVVCAIRQLKLSDTTRVEKNEFQIYIFS